MSELTIILTSYNRPRFVERAIRSVINQSSPLWRLIIQDDGSNLETLQTIHQFMDKRISVFSRTISPETRQATSRYATLINQTYGAIKTPYVGYMCDNVEYHPDMVTTVTSFFHGHPDVWSGYVLHNRDMWTADGDKRLGNASDFAHWDATPPEVRPITNPFGLLDHSQVFHRMPISARWEESRDTVKCGDGVFFTRLVAEHGPIMPIEPDKVLSYEHLLY